MRRATAVALALAAVLAIPASAGAAKGKGKGEKVTVMTRNVFLGADLGPAIDAPDLNAAIDGAAEIYREVEATNFPERAVPLAKEIKKAKPALVGLQEVANWREQIPGDGGWTGSGGIGTPAETEKYNFLTLLTDELGSKYEVVSVAEEFDAELPVDLDGNNDTGVLGGEIDARLTMRDVILKRKGVKTSKLDAGHFETRYEPLIGGSIPLPVDRGWLSTQAKIGKAKFKFVNTHLEAFGDPTIREAQAKELVAGPLKTKKSGRARRRPELRHDEPAQHRAPGPRPRSERPARLQGPSEGEVQGQRRGAELLLPEHVRRERWSSRTPSTTSSPSRALRRSIPTSPGTTRASGRRRAYGPRTTAG